MTERLNQIESTLAAITKRLNRTTERLDRTAERAEGNRRDIESLIERISNLEKASVSTIRVLVEL